MDVLHFNPVAELIDRGTVVWFTDLQKLLLFITAKGKRGKGIFGNRAIEKKR